MLTKSFKAEKLSVNIYDTRRNMGIAAAADVAACIKAELAVKPEIYMIFARSSDCRRMNRVEQGTCPPYGRVCEPPG